ncbi:MAG: hypothetical protein QNJ84_02270 [Alphaproteobacteria bacterium]|nr:hypothetical protein [Alphaproteobacteria bacterium]
MPTEKPKTKRQPPTSIRLRPDVLAHLHATKDRTGKSLSAQVNEAFGEAFSNIETPRQQRRPPIEKALLAQMLGELAVLKAKAHEIALAGGDNSALLLEEIRDSLIELRTILMRLLGRRR